MDFCVKAVIACVQSFWHSTSPAPIPLRDRRSTAQLRWLIRMVRAIDLASHAPRVARSIRLRVLHSLGGMYVRRAAMKN
jgi:hypothetical protein